ncbi:hypothetical protein Pmani_016412 [Petrolisthes manimaculis]|uniref:Uncharacterized protein n=1 Tax=Petrolisthes manimaculis TaxID=1843537 RepID=A0AAE1PRN4_9EUCA|nr:hypothetical protein Pmani_016412 [Petrolisthes manimaculis]
MVKSTEGEAAVAATEENMKQTDNGTDIDVVEMASVSSHDNPKKEKDMEEEEEDTGTPEMPSTPKSEEPTRKTSVSKDNEEEEIDSQTDDIDPTTNHKEESTEIRHEKKLNENDNQSIETASEESKRVVGDTEKVSVENEKSSTDPVYLKERVRGDTEKVGAENEKSSIDPVCLKKELGLVEGVTMIVGIVIGSGIFVTPKGVITIVGSVGLSLMVWLLTGIISLLGALCFAELGTMIPESGGVYCYLHESFGPLPAFLSIWVMVMVKSSAGLAVVALTFSSYLVQAVLVNCSTVPDLPVKLIAILLLCLLSWVNCVNVKWAAKIQNVFTGSKMLALLVIIVAGMIHLALGHTQNYHHPLQGSNWSVAAISAACYQSLFSYGGWDNLCYVVEELKNPDRNLPLSIVISMSLVTLLYVLVNVAYLAVLTPAEMITSSAVAVSFANLTLGVMAWIMPVFVLCSTFGSANGGIFTQSRLVFAGARRKQLPEAFSLINVQYFTPVPAVLLNGLTALMMLISSDMLQLIQYASFASTLTFFGCICSLIWFRYKAPYRYRPFKVWMVLPVLFMISQVFLLVLPLIYDPIQVFISIALIATGLPVYYLAFHRPEVANKCSGISSKLTYCCQMLFRSVPDEKTD